MPTSESTCWTMIRAAAAGSAIDREELARRYPAIVGAYLAARWRGTALQEELGDATQAVFVECFRHGGVLDAAGSGRVPGFRAFLYGVLLPERSFGLPFWMSSRSMIRVARPSLKRRRRAS